MPFETMQAAEASGSTYEKLDTLCKKLAYEIDNCADPRNLPQLSRQYRETVKTRDEYQAPEADELLEIAEGLDAVR